MQQEEHILQVTCVEWFRDHFKNSIIFAIPNGGWRKLLTAIKLKAEGATAGVPDLCIPEPCGDKHGLWIEMKVKGGVVRDTQKAMIQKLRDKGYQVDVCYNFLDFRNSVMSYFNIDTQVCLSPKDKMMKMIEETKLNNELKNKRCKKMISKT